VLEDIQGREDKSLRLPFSGGRRMCGHFVLVMDIAPNTGRRDRFAYRRGRYDTIREFES
jgi:hypothetical protein